MRRRESRDLDRRRLGLLALVFFAAGVVDVMMAVQMASWWTAAAAVLWAGSGVVLVHHYNPNWCWRDSTNERTRR